MALRALRWVPLLLVAGFAAFSNSELPEPTEYITPDCSKYQLPACPRDLSPVCGSDMSTYGNECTLCNKIREKGYGIKIIRYEPC